MTLNILVSQKNLPVLVNFFFFFSLSLGGVSNQVSQNGNHLCSHEVDDYNEDGFDYGAIRLGSPITFLTSCDS